MGFPDRHELKENFISGLASTLEVRVEAHIIGHLNVSNSDLTRAILIEDSVCLVNHISTASVHVTSNGTNELIERKFAVFVSIKVFDDLCNFDFRQVDVVVSHSIFELNRVKRSISVTVHSSEHNSKSTNSISTSLSAAIKHLLFDFLEIADSNMLFHVGVSKVKITSDSASSIHDSLLFVEVNVTFVVSYRFGLSNSLCHSTGSSEGVGSYRSTHVLIFTLKSFSVNCYWSSLSVISLRNSGM